jgi:N-acetylmuramoyl-L-alanine amidase
MSLICLALFSGCASMPRQGGRYEVLALETFCRDNGFSYTYMPFQEEIRIDGPSMVMRVKPGYSVLLVNNEIRDLGQPVRYRDGIVELPVSIRDVLDVRKRAVRRGAISAPLGIRRIVVDPGHGGHDPGAISCSGMQEKDLNLKVARMLRDELKRQGFLVEMTRDSDNFLSLDQRVEFIRRRKADLFISVHGNSNESSALSGLEVYYLASRHLNRYGDDEEARNRVERAVAARSSSAAVRKQLSDMLGREHRLETLELASLVLRTAREMGIETRKAKGAGFRVLKHDLCPAVLVELGYMSNAREDRLLHSPEYQRQLSTCIAHSVRQLNAYLEKTSSLASKE